MNDWNRAGANVAIHNARNEAANEAQAKNRALTQRDAAIESKDAWYNYAMELEEMVIELGSRLEATMVLIDQILRAANGEQVEHANKLLSPDGEELRHALVEKAQEISKTGMAQAYQDQPTKNSKKTSINKTYSPQSERFSKLWDNLTKVRATRGNKPVCQDDVVKMRELLLEIGPELIAANNLTLRLLAEGNGQQVPEKLLPAGEREARKTYLDAQAGNSRTGMIDASVSDIAGRISLKNPDSTVARQQFKIAGRSA
jgi:hypothetical protein